MLLIISSSFSFLFSPSPSLSLSPSSFKCVNTSARGPGKSNLCEYLTHTCHQQSICNKSGKHRERGQGDSQIPQISVSND